MNNIRATQRLNELELQHGTTGASWHDAYKDSAYCFVGGLDNELTEGDVITIMSQYGEVADVNMPRNKETGKTQGFAFLMYEDQRSTILAVDNLNGASVLGRTLRVDHTKNYKQMERGEDGKMKERETQSLNALPENFVREQEDDGSASDSPDPDIDPDDPMAAYLLEQKREKKRKRASKHEGESKEERRARKERKKAKKAAKELVLRDGEAPRDRGRDRDEDYRRSNESKRRRGDSRDRERDDYRRSRDDDRRRDDDERYRRDDRDRRDDRERRDERSYRDEPRREHRDERRRDDDYRR